jgi:hypothetical protein
MALGISGTLSLSSGEVPVRNRQELREVFRVPGALEEDPVLAGMQTIGNKCYNV